MSSSQGRPQPTTATPEIIVVTGHRYRVDGDVPQVERIILDAARGSIMQLASLTESKTRDDMAVNPGHIVLIRAARPLTGSDYDLQELTRRCG
jgi:hypothetical protein